MKKAWVQTQANIDRLRICFGPEYEKVIHELAVVLLSREPQPLSKLATLGSVSSTKSDTKSTTPSSQRLTPKQEVIRQRKAFEDQCFRIRVTAKLRAALITPEGKVEDEDEEEKQWQVQIEAILESFDQKTTDLAKVAGIVALI